MQKCGLEIERKYVILMPDVELIRTMEEYTVSDITQIYLVARKGETHRIRSRRYPDRTVYTETRKRRIDGISCEEIEEEIDEAWFLALSTHPATDSHPVIKTRHTFAYLGKTVEIDVYPQWQRSAVMEVELSDREEKLALPPFISIVKEVTGDHKYSNSSMSKQFPLELV